LEYFCVQEFFCKRKSYTENGSRIGSGLRQSPGVEFPQISSVLLICTHLREFNRGSFHAVSELILEPFSV